MNCPECKVPDGAHTVGCIFENSDLSASAILYIENLKESLETRTNLMQDLNEIVKKLISRLEELQ